MMNINLKQYRYHLTTVTLEHLIFIFDATKKDKTDWEKQLAYCYGILPYLSADIKLKIYFLGCSQSYFSQDLLTHGSQWFNENRHRCRLLNPILDALNSIDISMVVIFGTGEIFDLYDCLGTRWKQKLLLIRIGKTLQASNELTELISPNMEMLRQYLQYSIQTIKISGQGFFPLKWDNKTYKKIFAQQNFCLQNTKPLVPTLTLQFLLQQEKDLIITQQYTNGKQQIVTIKPELFSNKSIIDGYLSPKEVICFKQASQYLSYQCPHCSELHVASHLYCETSHTILPSLIYTSLKKYKGIIILCFEGKNKEKVVYSVYDKVFPVNNQRIVSYIAPNRAKFMIYTTQGWLEEEFISSYQLLGDNVYGLFL